MLGPPQEYAAALAAAWAPDPDRPDEPLVSVLGMPLDVRGGMSERTRARVFDPREPRLLVPRLMGGGWRLNYGAVAVRLGLLRPDDFDDEVLAAIPPAALTAARLAPLAVAGAVGALLAARWTRLPARVPTSFGVAGRPARFVDRQVLLAPAGAALGVAAWGALPGKPVDDAMHRNAVAMSAAALLGGGASKSSRPCPGGRRPSAERPDPVGVALLAAALVLTFLDRLPARARGAAAGVAPRPRGRTRVSGGNARERHTDWSLFLAGPSRPPRSPAVAMRMSSLFLRTLRENPADAEVPSHQLLVRAGYIRRVSPGIYTWLPLGLKVLKNVEQIVREEMDAIGSQELLFPALLPREPYEASGRWTEYGENIFRLKDRKGGDYLLGPTHEELFALAVKDMFTSYKDLPVSLYQIQVKYRDEARPRAGILRGREFVMKDAYSFDIDEAGLDKSYHLHRDAYVRVFDRLGFHYAIVQAMAGAMGGSKSEEFLATAANGEDTYVRCDECGYAANVEAVKVPVPQSLPYADVPPAHDEDTPDSPTIAALVDTLNRLHPGAAPGAAPWAATDTLKTLVVMVVHPDGTREPLALGIPGDREVDEKRLGAQLEPARVEAFEEKDFGAYPTLVKGYMGPTVLGAESESGIRFLVDPRVVEGTRWVAGGNAPGVHVVDLVAGRDFTPDGTIEAAEVRPGDACPNCGGGLEAARGIEMGHIFQLGKKYAAALDVRVLDENGKLRPVVMGSYGIGVSRAVAAIAEGNHDEAGLIWPRHISPADVHIVATGKDEAVFTAGEQLTRDLEVAGVTVLLDDRKGVSPGVKFKDSELIGIPTIVVIGRGLADGKIEIKDRRSGERREVPLAEAVAEVQAEIGR